MEQQKGLTGSTLKIIAMVTMLIDHIGASILERGVMPKVADGSVMDAGVEAMKVYNRWKVVDMADERHFRAGKRDCKCETDLHDINTAAARNNPRRRCAYIAFLFNALSHLLMHKPF